MHAILVAACLCWCSVSGGTGIEPGLLRGQTDEGAWISDGQADVAATALAVLQLTFGGNVIRNLHEEREAAIGGVVWLKRRQCFESGELAPIVDDALEHALGTLALEEYYAHTRSPFVGGYATRAFRYLASHQASDGSWPSARNGLRATAWAILATLSAYESAHERRKATRGLLGREEVRIPLERALSLTSRIAAEASSSGDRAIANALVYLIEGTLSRASNPTALEGALADESWMRDADARFFATLAACRAGGRLWDEWQRLVPFTLASGTRASSAFRGPCEALHARATDVLTIQLLQGSLRIIGARRERPPGIPTCWTG